MEEGQFKFKLIVVHSFPTLDLRLNFNGSSNIGVYNLLLPPNNGERHHWHNTPLKSSDWKTLCNTIRLARLAELPIEESESEWVMLDGGDFTIETEVGSQRVIRTRRLKPERRFCVVVNKMIDLIPQLDKQITPTRNLKDNYKFIV